MNRYLFLTLTIALSLLGIFGLVQVIGIPILTDPKPLLEQGSLQTALITIGLLTIDVFLPIPSSLVMIANGAIFGFVLGTAFSILGSIAAALLGYWLGVSGSNIINRFIPQDQQEKAKGLFEQWGALAVIVTRPIPILAETISIVSGISRMKLRRFVLAAILGIVPASALYAYSGDIAASSVSKLLIFGIVISIGGIFWFIGTLTKRRWNFNI